MRGVLSVDHRKIQPNRLFVSNRAFLAHFSFDDSLSYHVYDSHVSKRAYVHSNEVFLLLDQKKECYDNTKIFKAYKILVPRLGTALWCHWFDAPVLWELVE